MEISIKTQENMSKGLYNGETDFTKAPLPPKKVALLNANNNLGQSKNKILVINNC